MRFRHSNKNHSFGRSERAPASIKDGEDLIGPVRSSGTDRKGYLEQPFKPEVKGQELGRRGA